MATPDVRVRLSAEGVSEVVAALKKVQAEGEKAGRGGKAGFLGLNSVLGATTNLLAGFGIALGVHAFVKKTQLTPRRELEQARRVAAGIMQGDYEDE